MLSQGPTPVWVSLLAGQHFAASGQRSAPASLWDRPGPHVSSLLVSWGKMRNLSWFAWPKQNNYSLTCCDSAVNWTLVQAFGYITLIWPFFLFYFFTKPNLPSFVSICDSVHEILFLQTSPVLQTKLLSIVKNQICTTWYLAWIWSHAWKQKPQEDISLKNNSHAAELRGVFVTYAPKENLLSAAKHSDWLHWCRVAVVVVVVEVTYDNIINKHKAYKHFFKILHLWFACLSVWMCNKTLS